MLLPGAKYENEYNNQDFGLNEMIGKANAQKYLDDSIKMFNTQTGKGSRDLVSKVEKYLEDFNAKVSNFCWVSNE